VTASKAQFIVVSNLGSEVTSPASEVGKVDLVPKLALFVLASPPERR
jgi:hypothetical protein